MLPARVEEILLLSTRRGKKKHALVWQVLTQINQRDFAMEKMFNSVETDDIIE